MAKRKMYCIRCGRVQDRECEGSWYICCRCTYVSDQWGAFLHRYPSKDYKKLEDWQRTNWGKHWDASTGRKRKPYYLSIQEMDEIMKSGKE